jgi:tetratricopeptide (TPR) repeat protein
MTAPTAPIQGQARSKPARTIEQVLAHMHLKLGALALARVELETLAGLAALDGQGLVDLAEVRWRTGDLLGAGEAAAVALRADDADAVALVVSAEAAAAIGRPSEARRLATRALATAPDSIDDIFAGMPRSSVWAPDANEPAPSAPTLFDRGPEVTVEPVMATPEEPVVAPPAKVATGPMTLGFWDGEEVEADEDATPPDPARAFEAGRQALVAGSFEEAALRFGLALRLAPALAPAVLEATEGARASGLFVVRGDAYRLAGHEAEARQAYAVAARGGLPERRSAVRVRPRPTRVAVVPQPEVEVPTVSEDGSTADASGESAASPPDEPGEPQDPPDVSGSDGGTGSPETASDSDGTSDPPSD